MDKNNQNILYENLDMLELMESCDSHSMDFIMLFMPIGDGAIYTHMFAKGAIGMEIDDDETEEIIKYKNEGKTNPDELRAAVFDDEEKFNKYCSLIAKIVQNASRILDAEGTFCFAIPKAFFLIKNEKKILPDIKLMLSQKFEFIREMDVPNYSISEADMCMSGQSMTDEEFSSVGTGLTAESLGTEYTLYLCGDEVKNWRDSKEDTPFFIKREDRAVTRALLQVGNEFIGKLSFNLAGNLKWKMTPSRNSNLPLLNKVLIHELYDHTIRLALTRGPLFVNEYSLETRGCPTTKAEQQELEQKRNDEIKTAYLSGQKFQSILDALLSEHRLECSTLLSECLIKTFCKAGDRALFPYDRNGQYAWAATKFGLQWVSNYKVAYCIAELAHSSRCFYDEETGETEYWHDCQIKYEVPFVDSRDDVRILNYLNRLQNKDYLIKTVAPAHAPVIYDENFLLAATDANALKEKFSKYSSLLTQVMECVNQNSDGNDPNMEQAVHAIIKLAVKGQKGTVNGDEAEKWYGDGWDKLSEQCKDYLQTAAAYDKISQNNGKADYAPIGIEYYRALEHHLNRTLVDDLFAYIKENSEKVKAILKNAEQSNETKRIASTMSAILNDETIRGLTLGEIYQSLKTAATSMDEDVGSVIVEFCREKGYANLLSYDNVGLLGMAAQLRNLCAHPSDIDSSFMGLNLQIVRRTLKEQQVQAESQCDNNMSSVCAIIGPDNNKMKYPEDTTNMKAAIKSLILMFYKSGIRQYASTGNSGFDLLVGEVLKECRQSGEAKSIKVVEYLPCERDKMKFAPNRKKRVLAIDKFATIEVCGDADNAANKSVCQEKALENAAFCIAFYAEDGQSAIANRVKDAMQKGTIVYNTYGII